MKNLISNFEKPLELILDWVYTKIPTSQNPTVTSLRKAKIISHRGVFDNYRIFENTLESFRQSINSKVWGIEFDVRWTEDLVPIVLHDPTGERLFGNEKIIPSRMPFHILRQRAPFIPTLQEAIDEIGLESHLMIELKESISDPKNRKIQILEETLKKLRPELDFHILSFSTEVLRRLNFLPKNCLISLAVWDIKEVSEITLKEKWGGISSHYFLLNKKINHQHQLNNQKTGVGFISNKNLLLRSLNQNTDWIFSNNAQHIQQLLNQMLFEQLNIKV